MFAFLPGLQGSNNFWVNFFCGYLLVYDCPLIFYVWLQSYRCQIILKILSCGVSAVMVLEKKMVYITYEKTSTKKTEEN